MNKFDLVFISPHFDDVIYSCSQLIRNKCIDHKILVVTLFTDYNETSDNMFLNGDIRNKEDKEAMKSIGIVSLNLNFKELMIRNDFKDYTLFNQIIEPIKTLFYIKGETNLIENINKKLQLIIDQCQCKELYFPGAIGFHPDHIIAYRSCYNLKNVKLYIYEDFPYCLNKIYRNIRLPFIKTDDTISIKVDPSKKKEDIMKYKSQYDLIFENNDLDSLLSDFYEIYYKI